MEPNRWRDHRCDRCDLLVAECCCPSARDERQHVVEMAAHALDSIAHSDVERQALRDVLALVYQAATLHALDELGPQIAVTTEVLRMRVPNG